ncbi:MAG: twin-arginine translocase TatA/TatE family subunit [Bacteriovoracaceae bacterium]|jgi:TatA/E family protein of Tat protein translocase|nr:twin-arginine translocase TatA/TatE family subunit [Bacteriovoracaceae bacterium]
MFGLGAGELFLIFLIALFFLGPKKLPELAKGLGSAVREFNKAKDQMMQEIHKPVEPDQKETSKTVANTLEPVAYDPQKSVASTTETKDESSEVMTKKPESHS